MILAVPISEAVERRLVAKAKSVGVDVETYAATLLEAGVRIVPSLREISGQVADEFSSSCLTDKAFGDLLENEKHDMRAEKRARGAS